MREQTSRNQNALILIGTILLLLAGSDLAAIKAGGSSIRIFLVTTPVLLLIFAYFHIKILNRTELLFILLFSLAIVLSGFQQPSLLNTILEVGYFISAISCAYIPCKLVSSRINSYNITKIYIYAFRVQILVAYFLFCFDVQERAHLLYYEPSYFAIASIPYVTIALNDALYRKRLLTIDIIFLIIFLLISMSATLMAVIILASSLSLLTQKKNIKSYIYVLCITSLLTLCLSFYLRNYDNLFSTTLNTLLSSGDLLKSVLERSGNRWPRLQLGLEIAQSNFLFGVGAGNYSDFTLNYTPKLDYSKGLSWLNPLGMPPTNMWIEILAELGIFGLIPFLLFCAYIYASIPTTRSNLWLKLALVTFFLIMCIEASYLRLYFWSFLGFCAGVNKKKVTESHLSTPD